MTRTGPRTPRLALSQQEAAQALGVSPDFFQQHLRHEIRCVRRGRRRLYPVSELQRWLEEQATRALETDTSPNTLDFHN
jgi:excisionase family DNA binding protein